MDNGKHTLSRVHLAVVMTRNEKMKKNRKLDVNEVVFSFRTSYRALVVVIFSGILTNY